MFLQHTLLAFLCAASAFAQQALDAVAVRGTAELTPAAALMSARQEAERHVMTRWRERGEAIAESSRPAWIPASVASRAVERFLAEQDPTELLRVIDRDDRAREHEFGTSWQTTLWVAEDDEATRKLERRMRTAVGSLRQQATLLLGGTAVLWAVVAALVAWLDRLSRGYMTLRLRAIGMALCLSVPSLAFLL